MILFEPIHIELEIKINKKSSKKSVEVGEMCINVIKSEL